MRRDRPTLSRRPRSPSPSRQTRHLLLTLFRKSTRLNRRRLRTWTRSQSSPVIDATNPPIAEARTTENVDRAIPTSGQAVQPSAPSTPPSAVVSVTGRSSHGTCIAVARWSPGGDVAASGRRNRPAASAGSSAGPRPREQKSTRLRPLRGASTLLQRSISGLRSGWRCSDTKRRTATSMPGPLALSGPPSTSVRWRGHSTVSRRKASRSDNAMLW